MLPPSFWALDAANQDKFQDELIIDSFAGGGGASTGIELALGRSPDYAINHDREALALHAANHPNTVHLSKDIYKVDPMDVVGRRKVGLLWASPDCKHFSKAKGGKPVKREIRDLAWTVVLWAQRVRPRVIILENVEEFQTWGPLVETEKGVMPNPDKKGETFNEWVDALKTLGYVVEWKELRACDYGTPTTRRRLFLIARCDGRPIVWPRPTHAPLTAEDGIVTAWAKGQGLTLADLQNMMAYKTAASDVIDWSIPCPSIFDTSEEIMAKFGVRAVRPLASNTMARIAKGIQRYVIEATKPFIVNLTHGVRIESVDAPVTTVTGAHRGEKGIVVPHVTKFQTGSVGSDVNDPMPTVTANSFEKRPGGAAPLGIVAPYLVPRYGERDGQEPRALSVEEPMAVIVPTANGGSLVAPHLVSVAHGDSGGRREYPVDEPSRVVAGSGVQEALVAPVMVKSNHGDKPHYAVDEPVRTIVAGGQHHALIAPVLSSAQQGGSSRSVEEPHRTITASDKDQNQIIAAHVQRQFGASVGHAADEPVAAIMPGGGGKSAVVAAHLTTYHGEGEGGDVRGSDVADPVDTVDTSNRHGVVETKIEKVAAFLAQHNGGPRPGAPAHHAEEPISAITATGSQQAVVSAGLLNMRGSDRRMSGPDDPTPAVTAQGTHEAAVEAFLLKYYGNEDGGHDPASPMGTVTTKDRFGLVIVNGAPYQIVDIGMRMLTPRELFNAQGFPPGYQIERGYFQTIHREGGKEWVTYEWRALTKTAQVRMCGNSVCPPMAEALVAANCGDLAIQERIAAQ